MTKIFFPLQLGQSRFVYGGGGRGRAPGGGGRIPSRFTPAATEGGTSGNGGRGVRVVREDDYYSNRQRNIPARMRRQRVEEPNRPPVSSTPLHYLAHSMYTLVHMHTYALTDMHTCIHTHAHVHTHIYAHAHTHAHVHTHTHMNTLCLITPFCCLVAPAQADAAR